MTHRRHETVVLGLIGEQDSVLDEDGTGPEDEGCEEVDVYVVSGTVELPGVDIITPYRWVLDMNDPHTQKGIYFDKCPLPLITPRLIMATSVPEGGEDYDGRY